MWREWVAVDRSRACSESTASRRPHGRASDVATGVARALPDRVVFQYSATATPAPSACPG
jgi:hypothetical protein